MKKWIIPVAVLACFSLVVGCRHTCFRQAPAPACPSPAPLVPGAAPVPFPGAAPAVQPPAPIVPPPAPVIAPPAPVGQLPSGYPPPASPYSAPYPPPTSGYSAPYSPPAQGQVAPYPPAGTDNLWQAPKKSIHLSPPEPMKPMPQVQEEKQPTPGLMPPEPPDDHADPLLPDHAPARPKVTVPDDFLPVGIPQFAVALPQGVTGGLRPMLDGGLDWLRSRGYKAVLHLKRPGEDDSADQKQVLKRGMQYYSLEVSPETLADRFGEFAEIVSNNNHYPLFVYDKDGSLAGALWYLYFREVEEQSDDVARVRANTLGLRMETSGPHHEMWLAIQKYLSEKRP